MTFSCVLALTLLAASLTASLPLKDTSRCLVGPSFWCRSQETIALCHAEAYCAAKKGAAVVMEPGAPSFRAEPSVEKAAPSVEEAPRFTIKEESTRVSISMDDDAPKSSSSSSSSSPTVNADPCELCLEIANATIVIAESPEGRAAAKVVMEEACKGLPYPLEQRICDMLVSPIVDAIYDAIEAHVNVSAKDVCQALRLCGAKATEEDRRRRNRIFKDEARIAAEIVGEFSSSSSSSSSVKMDVCETCLEISNYTLKIAESPLGRAAAKIIVAEGCKALPIPLEQRLCQIIAGPIVDKIYDAIEAHVHLTPHEICGGLRLCGKKKGIDAESTLQQRLKSALAKHRDVVVNNINNNIMNVNNNVNNNTVVVNDHLTVSSAAAASAPFALPKANPLECQVCQITMKFLKGYATEDNKQTLIVYFNKTLCQNMDPSIRKNCSDDVVKIVDELFDVMEKQTPLQICQTIHACDAAMTKDEQTDQLAVEIAALAAAFPSSSSSSSSSPSSSALPRCRACEAAAAFAKSFATPENEKMALAYLDGALCGHVKPADRSNCTKMLAVTVGNLFSMIQGLTPRRFCEQVGLCFGDENGVVRVGADLSNNIECELCKYASQMLAPSCTPENAAAIVDYLNSSICQRYVTPDQRPMCEGLVKNATDGIFELVRDGTLCAKLGVCQEKKVVPWTDVLRSQEDAAQVENVAKWIAEEDAVNNVVINNINNNIMNVNNNVNGNKILVNSHVKVPAGPPPAASTAAPPLALRNPAECGICEYVGLALLLGQSSEAACQTAFASQPRTKVDACLAFAGPFAEAMKGAGIADHKNVMKLCADNKYC